MTFPSQVPDAGTPIFDAGGYINPVWHQFFFTLLNRTGGSEGKPAITAVLGDPPITSTGGVEPIIGITPATSLFEGSMSAADKTKLDTVTAGAAVSAVTGSAPISSSGGTAPDISISPATTIAPGSMSAADKTRLDGLSAASSPTFVAISLTNGQLVFPAVQVPSANVNTLDDYEEGTWAPVLTFSTPGNLAVAYLFQIGGYTKIGRQVFINFLVVTSTFTHTTASGTLLITGLPFASGIPTSVSFAVDFQGITKAGYTQISGRTANGETQITFVGSGSGLARSVVTTADTPTGGTVILSGNYSYYV